MPTDYGNVALVVPTCRPASLAAFLKAWEPHRFWDHLIVVEDDTPAERVTQHHYGYPDIADDLGRDHWIISRLDSAIRSYGFLVAYRLGAQTVVTLDDDTRPYADQDYYGWHRRNLDDTPRWTTSAIGIEPRGLPYRNRGVLPNVALSMGLWAGVPDLDSLHSLVGGPVEDFRPVDTQTVVPACQYFPLCGMNLAFRREIAPLMYFGLQGEGWPYRRFDDIWCGLWTKKIMDHLRLHTVVGRPWVQHPRESDPFTNLEKEAPGMRLNESLWEIIDRVRLSRPGPAGCMQEVGESLRASDHPYLSKLGEAMVIWSGLFPATR